VKIAVVTSVLHALLWGTLAVALVCVSMPAIFRAATATSSGPPQPFHSSDAYLQAVIGVPHASESVNDLLEGLPPQKQILIFIRQDDSAASLLGMSMGYLAWPHDVQVTFLPGPGCSSELAKIQPASVGAILFCNVQPPSWVPAGTRVGRAGLFVRLPSARSAK
jgi:hypothetical protein